MAGVIDLNRPSSSDLNRKRLTNYSADNVGCLLRLAQAAGVSSTIRLIGKSLNPGRTEPR